MWLENNGEPISFWHDVPLYPTEGNASIINFVVEIPRWTNGKIEIQREEPLNPIFHDTNDDGPRFVESVWPHKSYPFLYGVSVCKDHLLAYNLSSSTEHPANLGVAKL